MRKQEYEDTEIDLESFCQSIPQHMEKVVDDFVPTKPFVVTTRSVKRY